MLRQWQHQVNARVKWMEDHQRGPYVQALLVFRRRLQRVCMITFNVIQVKSVKMRIRFAPSLVRSVIPNVPQAGEAIHASVNVQASQINKIIRWKVIILFLVVHEKVCKGVQHRKNRWVMS